MDVVFRDELTYLSFGSLSRIKLCNMIQNSGNNYLKPFGLGGAVKPKVHKGSQTDLIMTVLVEQLLALWVC